LTQIRVGLFQYYFPEVEEDEKGLRIPGSRNGV
jgi:hypothetical protein